MNKVLYISPYTPIDTTARKTFYYCFRDAGFEVDWWQVPTMVYPDITAEEWGRAAIPVNAIRSVDDLKCQLVNVDIKSTLIILQDFYDERNNDLFEAVHDTGAKIGFVMASGPRFYNQKNFLLQIKDVSAKCYLTVKKRIKQLFSRQSISYEKKSTYFAPHIIFYMGEDFKYFWKNEKTIFIPVNYGDYEQWLEMKKEPQGDEKICLFLDTGFDTHPQSPFKGQVCYKEIVDRYYEGMRLFFDKVEADLGLPIIIAAHPRSNYASPVFGKRKIVKNETCKYATQADLFITDHSTSHAYAVYAKKPIFFVHDPFVAKYHPDLSNWSFELSNSLGAPWVNIRNLECRFIRPQVDEKRYKNYLFSAYTSPRLYGRSSYPEIVNFVRSL